MPDVALISLGTTAGLRRADETFAEAVRAGGASCEVVTVTIGRAGALRRKAAVTDLVEALAARRSALAAPEAPARVYSTVTASLLSPSPVPYAVRFDSPAALNRPGLSGAWQRAAERRALAAARLLLPWGQVAADAAPAPEVPRVVVPVAIEPVTTAGERDVDAVAYANNPAKRGLDLLCAAWVQAGGGRLVVGGIEPERARAHLARRGISEPPGVEWAGPLDRAQWLVLVSRARVFVNASRREDHGISQLEALAAGAALVTLPSPGAYEALPLARELDARLVAADMTPAALAAALRAGLGMDSPAGSAYADRAGRLLDPYRPERVNALVAERVLPALLGDAPGP